MCQRPNTTTSASESFPERSEQNPHKGCRTRVGFNGERKGKMANAGRSAVMAGVRTFTARSNNAVSRTLLTPKPIPAASPFPSSSSSPARLGPRSASRMVSALGAAESMMPLHSAIASARLKSSIAVDSSCWSWLSQGFATPF